MLSYHRALIADTERTARFQEAIEKTVSPGDVVIDVGTGTGVLAYFAVRAGAKHVYAIDRGEIIEGARRIAAQNGLSDRITFLRGEATEVALPEQADVLIGEVIGSIGLEEACLPTLTTLAAKALRPGGAILPSALKVFVAPWHDAAAAEAYQFFARRHFEIDFSPLLSPTCAEVYSIDVEPAGALSQEQLLFDVTFPDPWPGGEQAFQFIAEDTGPLDGFTAWMEIELCPGVHIDTAPTLGTGPQISTSWRQAFLPLPTSISVQEGDEISVAISGDRAGQAWSWQGEVRRAHRLVGTFAVATASRNLDAVAMLRAKERTQAGVVPPPLSATGAAMTDLMLGLQAGTPLHQLAATLVTQHPQVYSSVNDAVTDLLRATTAWCLPASFSNVPE